MFACLTYQLLSVFFSFTKSQSIQYQTILFTRYANTCTKLQSIQWAEKYQK